MMVALAAEVQGYAWELNKGYAAPEHCAALESRGPSVHHRVSWRLPGVTSDVGTDRTRLSGPAGLLMDDDGAVLTDRGGEQLALRTWRSTRPRWSFSSIASIATSSGCSLTSLRPSGVSTSPTPSTLSLIHI